MPHWPSAAIAYPLNYSCVAATPRSTPESAIHRRTEVWATASIPCVLLSLTRFLFHCCRVLELMQLSRPDAGELLVRHLDKLPVAKVLPQLRGRRDLQVLVVYAAIGIRCAYDCLLVMAVVLERSSVAAVPTMHNPKLAERAVWY